jgi:hypothetical protein
MKTLSVYRQALILFSILTLAQLACGLLSSGVSTAVPSSGQAEATSIPNPAQEVTQPSESTAARPERGTPDEAKAMLQLAVEHYTQVGRDQALKDFNNGAPPFIDRDLYVVCLGRGGVIIANGGFPQYVGVSADALKDAEGKPVGTTIWTQGNAQNEGSIEYNWVNPVSGKTEPKIFFFQKVGEDVCGVGAYNP